MVAQRHWSAAAAVIGGLALACAFPPWSVPGLAPVGVAALVLAVPGHRVRAGAATGFVFGLAFLGPTLWWLSQSISVVAWAALVVVQGGWFALLGAATTLVRPLRWSPAWVAALWTAVEGGRSAVPWGGLPWGRLGHTAVDTPWAASLPFLGVAGAGAFVALMGAALAAVVHAVHDRRPVLEGPRSLITSGFGVVALLAAYLLAPAGWLQPTNLGRQVRATVAVVQAEVPGDGTDVVAHHRRVTQTLLAETRRLAQTYRTGSTPDLVLWPENATAVDPTVDEEAQQALLSAAALADAPVLAGSITEGPTAATALNQAIVWTSAQGASARYTKQHLVPFGEYVPLRRLASRLSSRVAEIPRDMVPGREASPLPAADLTLATALCFDIAYDDVVREQVAQGAQLVTVQTSNAMFLGTAQQEQQWLATRARALEVGRAVVVSSMNGMSGAIGPDGSVIARLPVARAGSTLVTVPLPTATTLAVRLGAWPSRVACLAAAMAVLVGARRARTTSPRGNATVEV